MAPTNPSFVRRLQVLMTMTIVVMMVSSQHRDGGGLALVAAVDHNVGGSSNWDLSVDYTTWASSQTFAVGDNLVFTWSGNHDVVVVSEADYNGCTKSSSSVTYTSSPKSIPLTATGTSYYICSITGHCGAGMKVAVTVAAASSSSNTTTTTTPSPPPPSSSSSSSTPGSSDSPSMFHPSLFTTAIILCLSLVLAVFA